MLQLGSKKVKWTMVLCAVAPFPETLSHASQQMGQSQATMLAQKYFVEAQ